MSNEPIGNTDAICPHCNQRLDRMPGRKKMCPHCAKFIFVRTRPSDKQRVLVTQDQVEQIEEQWSIVDGTHEAYLAAKERALKEKARLTPVGNTDAICPHCNQRLDKMPGRKKKCPHCAKFIFVRTRPSDRQCVLVTQDQVEQIEEQWSIVNGTHEAYLAEKRRFSDEKARLAKRFGREPSDNEVEWSILGQDMMEHASQRQWGLFRNAKFGMAEILRKESQLVRALGMYLELCYLDLNGPCNIIRGETDPDILRELLREYPPWDPKRLGELAPGILERIDKIIKKTNTSQSNVETMFVERATKLKKSLRLPVSVSGAWGQVQEALF